MAQIIINIPDGNLTEVIDAICIRDGYTVGSGLTKAQFAKQQIVSNIKSYVQHARILALRTASESDLATAIGNIVLPDIT